MLYPVITAVISAVVIVIAIFAVIRFIIKKSAKEDTGDFNETEDTHEFSVFGLTYKHQSKRKK